MVNSIQGINFNFFDFEVFTPSKVCICFLRLKLYPIRRCKRESEFAVIAAFQIGITEYSNVAHTTPEARPKIRIVVYCIPPFFYFVCFFVV